MPRDVVRGRVSGRDLALSALAAALVSGVLYSSFLTHPAGLVDSVRAYGIWLSRAGTDSWHAHPWDYYFRLLIHFPSEPLRPGTFATVDVTDARTQYLLGLNYRF